ncbi:MAG: tetratricopeptide repeat protein [Verrucomicrobia bacterium]|nr:tetratricopeptide repeat protein [Verrucomicrobiota bacterium]
MRLNPRGLATIPFARLITLRVIIVIVAAHAGWFACLTAGHAADLDSQAAFKEANRLYVQGKYAAASDAYETLIQRGESTPSAWFNLANARLRNNEPGRAIAALLHAQLLSPSDPGIRSNLDHIRSLVHGDAHTATPLATRILNRLSIGQWATLGACATGLFFLLLAAEERKRNLSSKLSPFSWSSAGVAIACWAIALTSYSRQQQPLAVVIAREAPVKFTPLEESPVAFTAVDGTEFEVLREELNSSGKPEWLEVREKTGRLGWIRVEKVQRVARPITR